MTQLQDRYGLPLTTASVDAAKSYIEGLDRLLSFNWGSNEQLTQAIEADPNFAMSYAALAIHQWWYRQGDEGLEMAQRAAYLSEGLSERERKHIAVVKAVVEGSGYIDEDGRQAPNPEGIRHALDYLAEFPKDALALFLAIILTIFSGRKDEKETLVDLLQSLESHYGEDWWFLSWHGFCHSELGRLESGRRITEHALQLNPRNTVASHSYGHVFYQSEEYQSGADFLHDWLPEYDHRAIYNSHISWHYAIFELLLGNTQRALEVYHRDIDPASVSPVHTTLPDSVGLLWRCYIYGTGTTRLPWDGILSYAARLQPGIPFRDVLVGTALAGAGDQSGLRRLMEGIKGLDRKLHPTPIKIVSSLLQGVDAFTRGGYEETIRLIEPLTDDIERIGGSNQQRELFEETLLEAYLRSGYRDRAEEFLLEQVGKRPYVRRSFWLSRIKAHPLIPRTQ